MAILSDNPQYDFEKEGRTAERAKNISFDEFLARDENIFERGADRLVERLLDRAFDEERYDFVDRYVADLCGGGRRAEPAILSTGNARLLSYAIDESVFRADAKLPEARFHTAAVEINDAATSVVLGAARTRSPHGKDFSRQLAARFLNHIEDSVSKKGAEEIVREFESQKGLLSLRRRRSAFGEDCGEEGTDIHEMYVENILRKNNNKNSTLFEEKAGSALDCIRQHVGAERYIRETEKDLKSLVEQYHTHLSTEMFETLAEKGAPLDVLLAPHLHGDSPNVLVPLMTYLPSAVPAVVKYAGIDVDAVLSDGTNSLLVAMNERGGLLDDVAEALVREGGADVNIRLKDKRENRSKTTPFLFALSTIRHENMAYRIPLIEAMLESGADLESVQKIKSVEFSVPEFLVHSTAYMPMEYIKEEADWRFPSPEEALEKMERLMKLSILAGAPQFSEKAFVEKLLSLSYSPSDFSRGISLYEKCFSEISASLATGDTEKYDEFLNILQKREIAMERRREFTERVEKSLAVAFDGEKIDGENPCLAEFSGHLSKYPDTIGKFESEMRVSDGEGAVDALVRSALCFEESHDEKGSALQRAVESFAARLYENTADREAVLESWKDEAEKRLENERSEKERICSEQEQEQDDGILVL